MNRGIYLALVRNLQTKTNETNQSNQIKQTFCLVTCTLHILQRNMDPDPALLIFTDQDLV